jgi:hypothetical protein
MEMNRLTKKRWIDSVMQDMKDMGVSNEVTNEK